MATARPTSTRLWFASLNVSEIKGLEYINTSETTDMFAMFKGCAAKNLDLSHFDTRKVTDMKRCSPAAAA
jgi:surface protein